MKHGEPGDFADRPADGPAAASDVSRAGGRPADRRLRLGGMPWRVVLPAAAALALGLGFLYGIRLVARPLAFLVIAVAIAEALAPLVRALERLLPRSVAIALLVATVLGVLGALGWVVGPVLIAQGQELVLRAPELAARLDSMGTPDDSPLGSGVGQAITTASSRWAGALLSLPLKVFGALLNVVVVVFLAVYWLVGAPELGRFTMSLVPVHRQRSAAAILREAGQAMGGYVRGAAINAVVMGLLAYAGLSLLGVNYALALGVVTFLAEPIPIIGPIVAAIPVVAVALLQSPRMALAALGLYFVLQQLEGQLLTPNIMRRQTDMPQTVVLFAVLAGGAVGGLLGILASVPLAAALRVLVLRLVVPAVRRWTGADAVVEDPPIPASRPA